MTDGEKIFAGAIPKLYDAYLVPLIFEPYALDIARRLASYSPRRVLEIAAGTGVLTRALDAALEDTAEIVATDLNQAMLDQAISSGARRNVTWLEADAMHLPFETEMFDAVVCQFGAMFFPEKARAFAEVFRVLQPGGVFIFNVWDRLEDNEFADTVASAIDETFPSNQPNFLKRAPYSYYEREVISRDLATAGFSKSPRVETVTFRSVAESPRVPAVAFCQGTPARTEIEAHGSSSLGRATEAASRAIAARFGQQSVDGKIQAVVFTVER
jgi:ubiquinone/menaquinone biosynthesis C-methylase UbiE